MQTTDKAIESLASSMTHLGDTIKDRLTLQVQSCSQNSTVTFGRDILTENDDLSQKYNTIWDKVSAGITKEFDGKPVYNKNILKIKIKSVMKLQILSSNQLRFCS